jgi:hypothetical protein
MYINGFSFSEKEPNIGVCVDCNIYMCNNVNDDGLMYRKERAILEADRDKFVQVSKVSQEKCVELEQKVNFYSNSHEHMTSRLQKLEDDDKTRSARVHFSIISFFYLFYAP